MDWRVSHGLFWPQAAQMWKARRTWSVNQMLWGEQMGKCPSDSESVGIYNTSACLSACRALWKGHALRIWPPTLKELRWSEAADNKAITELCWDSNYQAVRSFLSYHYVMVAAENPFPGVPVYTWGAHTPVLLPLSSPDPRHLECCLFRQSPGPLLFLPLSCCGNKGRWQTCG